MDDSITITCPICNTKIIQSGLDFAKYSDGILAGTVKSYMDKVNKLEAENAELRKWKIEAQSILKIAASYKPEVWPTIGLKMHCNKARDFMDKQSNEQGEQR